MIYLVTELVRPLDVQLKEGESCDVVISWGLHQITVGFYVHVYHYYYCDVMVFMTTMYIIAL